MEPAWPLSTGPEAQRFPKKVRPVLNHAIADVWRQLGQRSTATLIPPGSDGQASTPPSATLKSEMKLGRSSFGWASCPELSPSGMLSPLLSTARIFSPNTRFPTFYTPSTGPKLLSHDPPLHSTTDVCGPFTPALGIPIASRAFPYFKGTGGLYLDEDGESDRVFLLTACHVALPPSQFANDTCHCEKRNSRIPRYDSIHLGAKAFRDALEAIVCKIGHDITAIHYYKGEIAARKEDVEEENAEIRRAFEDDLAKKVAMVGVLTEFHTDTTRSWSLESQRALGHVFYPPITVNAFTIDCQWSLVALNAERFDDKKDFQSNVIHLGAFRSIPLGLSSVILGTKNTPADFIAKMYPHQLSGLVVL